VIKFAAMTTRALLLSALLAGPVLADSQPTVPPPAPAPADRFAAQREPAARLIGNLYANGRALPLLEELSDTVGARLTGSPGYTKGAEWVAAQLRAAGAENVHFEPFTLEHGWQRGVAHARMIAPVARPLHVESSGWSAATPKGGVKAGLVALSDPDPAAMKALIPSLKGKIVIFDRRGEPSGKGRRSPKVFIMIIAAMASLRDAGVAGVLMPMGEENYDNTIATGAMEFGGKTTAIPIASIGHEDGQMLLRALDHGPVTVELELPNVISGPVHVQNVVGELKGSERPDEWILLGAHLDSWDFATGSQDNGAGVAQVIDAARALAASGPHKRTIRFALWAGEEEGLNGSRAYTVAHEAELGKCVALLNTDNGAGHVKGWKVEGRKDLKKALAPFAKAILAPIGAGEVDMTLSPDTDHFPFVLAGVPALDLLVDEGNYMQVHHKSSDTVDRVEAHALESGAAVVAVTAGWLASTAEPFAPRLDHAGIEEVLKGEEGLLDFLKARGIWK